MRRIIVLLFVSVVSLIDVVLTTVFYCQGRKFHQTFKGAFFRYSFTSSVFDLWILCVLRCSVSLGLVLGILLGREIGINRVKSTRTISVFLAGICVMFTLIKLLSVSEHSQLLNNVWFWSLFTWTLVSSVLLVLQWRILGNITVVEPPVLKINCDGDPAESEALLGDKKEENKLEKDKDKKKSDAKSTILRLFSFSKPDWMFISAGFLFLTLSATGEIFIPFYTGKVVDGIVIDKSQKEFTKAIIVMALISVGSAITAGLRGGCMFMANRRLNLRIRNALFSSIVNQEVGFFDTVQTGDITSRLTSDTTTMSDTLGLNVNIFLRSLIKALGVLFFMFKLSWRLTVVTFIGLPCMLAVSKIYGKYYKKLSEEVQDSLASANNVAEEACSTMRTVRSFANEKGEIQRYADKLAVTYKLNKKQALMYSGFVWSNMLFELALTVSVLYYGGHLVIDGALTGGTLISFILYQIQLGDCVDSMGYVYTGLMQAAGASEKVFEYIDRKPQINHQGNLAPDDIQGHIEFKDVCFSYPSRPDVPVLKNISFTVNPGEVIALVGPSGGGKTSCVNLLEYFYTPQSGQVLLDNMSIQLYDHHYLHKQVSLVGQEPVLYARSIEENIRYGLHENEWSDKLIKEAAEMANAHSFITELKDGYKTQTGEKGVQMSGGQKQRIAIARALLRKPRVLLLDEATSALDAESEYLVQQALYKSLSGRTVIIIAHRLSTVERADRIIVIDKGEVIEQGTHKQLLGLKGIYTNLVKRQLLLSDNAWSKDGPNSPGKESGQLTVPQECSCYRRHRSSNRHPSGRISSRHASGNSVLSEEDGTGRENVTFIVGSI
ncbi:ABC-type oligopeptide transporter ABCB9-like isoform X2 [Mercenaria mercenaria]|uniref:ABC-type oligopeptide transporter ABCB9-like isoform X2 n=1 Tax=Mercenaria mercenaria TaxID=6596 RepID=UPI00234F9F2D|nr:ABC-type oligopeptide transporter ABCB9-like isoform X2 [Mercenaria mercenaria]